MMTQSLSPKLDTQSDQARNLYRVPKVIHDQGEKPLELYSNVEGPIASLTFKQRALLFAEFSLIAYNDEAEASKAAAAIGFPRSSYLNHDGSQAYCFRSNHDCVLVCRGTETSEWNDLRADVNVGTVLVESMGRVHRGFNREVDDIWPSWEKELQDNELPVYFCGHSLGGAMATICAARCKLSPIKSNPKELFTYGSPRVGCKDYIKSLELNYYRFVNNNDIVTRIPPVWLGYQHSGHEVYFNRNGKIANYGYIMKRRDRWRGFFQSLLRWKLDHLSDHSVQHYCENLLKAVREELEERNKG
jgi:triacylglycerol lipase